MKFNLCIVGRDMDGVKGEEGEKKNSHRKTKQNKNTPQVTRTFILKRRKKEGRSRERQRQLYKLYKDS